MNTFLLCAPFGVVLMVTGVTIMLLCPVVWKATRDPETTIKIAVLAVGLFNVGCRLEQF